jgi:hypothetical protein
VGYYCWRPPIASSRPFTDRQIALIETFAYQAVIAIENTRLFEAEQASERELIDANFWGYRSMVAEPMLKDGCPIGAIAVLRRTLSEASDRPARDLRRPGRYRH